MYTTVGDMDLSAASGSVTVTLPAANEFYLDHDSGSGSLTNLFDVIRDAEHVLKIDTASGSTRVVKG